MRNLDDFLYKLAKDNMQDVPPSFTNTIKNFSPNSKESRNLIMKIHVIKKAIIALTSLVLSTGVVFAATKTYENIWKQPEKVESFYFVRQMNEGLAPFCGYSAYGKKWGLVDGMGKVIIKPIFEDVELPFS